MPEKKLLNRRSNDLDDLDLGFVEGAWAICRHRGFGLEKEGLERADRGVVRFMNGTSQALSKSKCLLITAAQCGSILQHYGTTRSLASIKTLHAYTVTSGLLFFDHSSHIRTNLIASYAFCGNTTNARVLFDDLPQRNSFLWNVMIRAYSENCLYAHSLRLYVKMLSSEHIHPDNFTFPFTLKACTGLSLLNMGMSIHCRALATGFDFDTYVQNSLLAMYMNCGKTEMARRVFDQMQERTVVSWNTMINGYLRNGLAEEAITVFNWMMYVDEKPDHATLVSVLPACAHSKDLQQGRWIHDLLEEKGLGNHIPVRNSLVDMYAKCGSLDEARLVFDEMVERDVVSWTAMIVGYLSNGDATNALALGNWMHLEGIRPNSVTLAALLSSSASLSSLKHGKCLHGWAIRCRLEADVMVETALIDMYAKCNRLNISFRVFTKATRKGTVPWNALIAGCVHNRLANKAIRLFKQMLMEEGVYPDFATLISLLPAFAALADLWQAKNIHCYLITSGFFPSVETATVLIDIYSKCGNLDSAHELFNKIPEKVKDTVAWSAIIAGYGLHGNGGAAISLFDRMLKSGVKPNEVTFISVLHACSHAGMVDEGLHLFKSMIKDHHMIPQTDHYTCIVDLVGRSGRLEEAYELIKMMPFEPNHAVWGALLGACVIHGDVQLGEVAAKQLFELEPDNTGNYVLMAKIYAAVGRWQDAENIRSMMSEMGLRKTPAHSFIDVRNAVNA